MTYHVHMEKFLPELERVLRSKRGVIACTIARGRVAVMVSADADVADVRWTANDLATRHGADDVVVLVPPPVRAPRRAYPLRQTFIVAGASGLFIAGLSPAAGHILPRVDPIALEPAPVASAPAVVAGRSQPLKVLPKKIVKAPTHGGATRRSQLRGKP